MYGSSLHQRYLHGKYVHRLVHLKSITHKGSICTANRYMDSTATGSRLVSSTFRISTHAGSTHEGNTRMEVLQNVLYAMRTNTNVLYIWKVSCTSTYLNKTKASSTKTSRQYRRVYNTPGSTKKCNDLKSSTNRDIIDSLVHTVHFSTPGK